MTRFLAVLTLVTLAGCGSDVTYRGAPPAGYTHEQYVCALTGQCPRKRPPQAGDPAMGSGVGGPI